VARNTKKERQLGGQAWEVCGRLVDA
jgi:hypothetical protein